ncbi:MAG: FKBP-type peptidyl-prolyl cis-trans isomerase [Candidatus Marinimicrobia bacterium]|jgi:FKBP-type peptidyl-prolyl cis-trans isomerase|nr:FKBP-type peptidyl-prolyl cis-trans isomerase [Candidatus Neomarinimicrobiota bacterium]MBT3495614.1 FKBP-type peptidyl-prolyl cis-trans isomerase [Candidatus Neomarinimicrobiota bacterium]MBT3693016.1 FKBP-type peptidyl-prolyl cis-trans isomerase [Candidatus Neomarinimicrobiota bacterium]MBT3732531.1 FKBP-type peptidyl-prolyl cis-trans isomerase [Candidatus Neomarinimicrobiota bacterium]MBT4145203.1 FKBP-type peptidyl-prolyl cis-trans isomerase [Candidatus Neomarinimicrobiota bacterium]
MKKNNFIQIMFGLIILLMVSCDENKGDIVTDTLIIEDIVVGEGAEAESFDKVTVDYTGKLSDGTVFDSSKNPGREPFVFTVGVSMVIKGWDEGVPGMKVGGTRKLTIPPDMGYGSQGAGGVIPPNATLIFDIELLKVEK